MEKQRAVAYIRVSGERQVTEGSSLITQESTVKSYAMQRGYLLLRVFTEAGQSAKTDQRPVLKELLAYCRTRRESIEIVVFPKVDRFARYTRDYMNLKHQLQQLGIRLESVSEGFNDTPAGRFMESVLAATAQYDNEVRAERVKDGALQALKDGRWTHLVPLGYRKAKRNNKATIEPCPIQAPLIREAFLRLGRHQHRPKDVRTWLATKGIELSRSGFYHLIHNPVYIGLMVGSNGTYQGLPPFVGLVSEHEFATAKNSLHQVKMPRHYERDHADFPLRGTIRCQCGRLLTACWSQGNTKKHPYYRCTSCPRVNIPKAVLERWFGVLLDSLRPGPNRVADLRDQVSSSWEKQKQEFVKDGQQREDRVVKIRKVQQTLALKNAEGVIPDEVAKAQIQDLERKIERLESKRIVSSDLPDEADQVVDFAVRFLTNPGHYWLQSNLTAQKRLQQYYFPSGLTYSDETHFRTPRNEPFTGWRHMLQPQLSSVVGKKSKTPNFVASKQSVESFELTRLFQEFYQRVKPPEA